MPAALRQAIDLRREVMTVARCLIQSTSPTCCARTVHAQSLCRRHIAWSRLGLRRHLDRRWARADLCRGGARHSRAILVTVPARLVTFATSPSPTAVATLPAPRAITAGAGPRRTNTKSTASVGTRRLGRMWVAHRDHDPSESCNPEPFQEGRAGRNPIKSLD